MGRYKQQKEEAFAIYHEGHPYVGNGNDRKTIYKTVGAARGVITTDTARFAKEQWDNNNPPHDWYQLSLVDREKLAEDYARRHFTIMEYGPVKQVWPG